MSISIPRRLPLLIVSDNVLLPGSSMRIPVRSMHNINMVRSRLLARNSLGSTVIGVVPNQPGVDDSDLSSFHDIGTAAIVVQVTGTNWPQPSYTLLVTGLCRFKLEDVLQETPYPVARVTQLDKLPGDKREDDMPTGNNEELDALAGTFREQAAKLVDMLDISIPVVAKLKSMLDSLPNEHFPDICASIVKASYTEKLQVLDAVDLTDRFKKTLPLLMRQIEGLNMLKKVKHNKNDIRSINARPINMRRAFRKLPQNMFDHEDDEDEVDDMQDFEKKIKAAKMPEYAEKAAYKELRRLRKITPQMPEHAMIRTYLELLVDLPWSKQTTDILDIVQARKDLDTDHYALESLKKRVIEYLAVRQLKNSLKGPILCFVGPPGVGKTSVGKSIANTLGREFHRISLGGVCDQSDIRGHRRTYIGSMPGRIVQALNTVGTNNPVILLDEIDKLGSSLHGDPAAALLEVLDPEQNHTFTDHYLNVPFDLSQVLFIATANNLQTIPAALLDRMEVITVPGYTQEEKVHIANRHLIPKQLVEHGLTMEQLQIPSDTITHLITKYTYEAGVRQLERTIGAVCRAVAVKVAEKTPPSDTGSGKSPSKSDSVSSDIDVSTSSNDAGDGDKVKPLAQDDRASDVAVEVLALPPEMPIVIDEQACEDILGPRKFEHDMQERVSQPGVAVGLAWTMMGGEIMYVEANKMEGDGKLTLTGQLGDVMKESANLALNWVRSQALQLGVSISGDLLEHTDVHIHFPAGAVSKDGPSAGVTIVTVLVSLFSGRQVRADTAMTGEITLRGLVLPVGGIKEKVLAAHRAGMKRVILPKRNEKDLKEVANNVKSELTFIFAKHVNDVLNAAFDGGFPGLLHNAVTSKL